MNRDYGFGKRLDGTYKGPGFAAMQLPNGDWMTELSAGVPGEAFYPLVYEGITPMDMHTLANVMAYGYDPLMREVEERAYRAYLSRTARGLSPFWTPDDGPSGMVFQPRY